MFQERFGEPALPDAGLAGEQDQAPVSGERAVEAGDQLGELPRPADEGPARPCVAHGRDLDRLHPRPRQDWILRQYRLFDLA